MTKSYIKSGKGKLSTIHTAHDELTVRLLMREIMALLPEKFCRVHAGYIINTDALESIRRYTVRLKNGLSIPIPVKRYNAVFEDVKVSMGARKQEG
ncbi:MAG: LytTR family DNA-binding domain-containing protein [Clostridia bacterium]|nr:LytTR family DNA-binding domain-containing protein [Clostridia bacterium]